MANFKKAIQKIRPFNGAVGVPSNTTVHVTFNTHMRKSSVEDRDRVQVLHDGTSVSGVYSYETSNKTLVISGLALEPGETYQVHIKSGDEGPLTFLNHPLEYPFTSSFTTEHLKKENEEEEDTTDKEEEKEEEESDESGTEVIEDPFTPAPNRVHLVDSFPQEGDLVDLNGQMVFVFSDTLDAKSIAPHIYIKEAHLNPLLESIHSDRLIKGTLQTEDEKDRGTTFIFQPNQPLAPGTQYQVVLSEKIHSSMEHDIRITFHTLFERMFAEVDTVKLVLGRFADRLTDLEIAKLINQQSNSIYQLASMTEVFEESDWVEEDGVFIEFPYAASQYVVYSTAYYAILGQSLETSSGLSESIKLADLSVSGSSEVSDNLSDLLKFLKEELDRWWNVLQGEAEEIEPGQPNPNYSMGTATRAGETAPYPDFQTRVPFEDIGGGTT